MSDIEDQNRAANEQAMADRKAAAQEHMAEMERQRLQSEAYRNPLWLKFWAKRKAQTQALRDKVLAAKAAEDVKLN
jgi:hypothetical protein